MTRLFDQEKKKKELEQYILEVRAEIDDLENEIQDKEQEILDAEKELEQLEKEIVRTKKCAEESLPQKRALIVSELLRDTAFSERHVSITLHRWGFIMLSSMNSKT